MKLTGKMIFRNNNVCIFDGNHEIDLFCWLASLGLKGKQVEVEFSERKLSVVEVNK